MGWNSKLGRGSTLLAITSIYPVFVLSRVLFWETESRLGPVSSDMDGTLRNVQRISVEGIFATCSRWNDFPVCTSVYTPSFVLRLGFNPLFALLTTFFNPQLALNLAILFGWVSTGLVVFLLCRHLRMTRINSYVAVLLVQVLPWMREKSTEHFAYMFVSIPLLTIYFALLLLEKPGRLRLALTALSVATTGLFDLYWFYFSLSGLAIALCILPKSQVHQSSETQFRPSLNRWLALLGLVIGYLSLISLGRHLTTQDAFVSIGERQLEPASASFVASFSGSMFDYFVPNAVGEFLGIGSFDPGRGSDNIYPFGLAIFVLAVLGFRSHRNLLETKFLGITSVFYILLSIGKIEGPLVEIPPLNALFRLVFPGVRVFLRSGLLAEVIICIFAALGFSQISKLIDSRRLKGVIATTLFIIIFVELRPINLPKPNVIGREFSSLKEFVEETPNSALLLTKSSIIEDIRSIKVPIANSPDKSWERTYFAVAAQGNQSLAEFLQLKGITFVLAQLNERGQPFIDGSIQDYALFSTELGEPYFQRLGSPIRSNLNQDRVLQLLKVKGQKTSLTFNVPCLGAAVNFDPQTQIDPGVSQEISDDVWWISSPKQILMPDFVLSPPCPGKFHLHLEIVPALGQWATKQTIQFRTRKTQKSLELVPGERSTVLIPMDEGRIDVESFEPCFIPSKSIPNNSDGRTLCFGITRLWIETSDS